MVLAADLIAAIRATQAEPPGPEAKLPGTYDSDCTWEFRSRCGRVYVTGVYCCSKEPNDPDHSCPGVRVVSSEILDALGLTKLVYTPPDTFARVTS